MSAGKGSFEERAKKCYDAKELERLGITLSDEQREAVLTFLGCVLRDNKSAELIPAADEEQIFLRHFCDSLQLLLLFGFKRGATILDIGSSGGFPVFPVNIMRPDLSFIILESSKKKITFLEDVTSALGLNNVTIINGKPESANVEQPVDYVITRNTWTLQKFSQLARRFLTSGGYMYAYKTKGFDSELDVMTDNKERDGIKIGEIAQYDLGNLMGERHLISMLVM